MMLTCVATALGDDVVGWLEAVCMRDGRRLVQILERVSRSNAHRVCHCEMRCLEI